MKLQYTFKPSEHRFKCTKCGKCCHPTALSLTERECYYLTGIGIKSDSFLHDSNPPFRGILKVKGRCPFLGSDKLCKIYHNRPIVCLSFPLTFECLDNDTIFVNFIRCEGADNEEGEIVDDEFVNKTIVEIMGREPKFFEQIQMKAAPGPLVPLYTSRDLTLSPLKLKFMDYLAELLIRVVTDRNNLRASIHGYVTSVRELVGLALRERRLQSALVLDDDLQYIMDYISSEISRVFEIKFNEIVGLIDRAERLAIEEGKCELLLDGKTRSVGIHDSVELKVACYETERKKVKVSNIYLRKELSPDAFKYAIEYLSELFKRVGLGGFPIDAPLMTILDVFAEFINNLEFQWNLYSGESPVVDLTSAKMAISDLDTCFTLGSMYTSRITRL